WTRLVPADEPHLRDEPYWSVSQITPGFGVVFASHPDIAGTPGLTGPPRLANPGEIRETDHLPPTGPGTRLFPGPPRLALHPIPAVLVAFPVSTIVGVVAVLAPIVDILHLITLAGIRLAIFEASAVAFRIVLAVAAAVAAAATAVAAGLDAAAFLPM